MLSEDKKFNGKTYVLQGGYYKENDARQVAKSIREQGNKARVIKSGDTWYVYMRFRYMK